MLGLGIVTGIVTAIKTAVTVGAKVIAGLAAKVGPAIVKAGQQALTIAGKIASKVEEILPIIERAFNLVRDIANLIGFKNNIDNDPGEIGYKIEKDEESIEDYDNDPVKYVEHLHKDIEIDREEYDKLSPEKKAGYSAAGLSLATSAVGSKLGFAISMSSLMFVELLNEKVFNGSLNAERILDIINQLKDGGVTKSQDVMDYLEGVGNSDREKTGNVLKPILGENMETLISAAKEYRDGTKDVTGTEK